MAANNGFMQSRAADPTGLDDFPTPPWATRALCWRLAMRHDLARMTVREPCANRGYMVRPLWEFFGAVDASDLEDYGAGFPVGDYLNSDEGTVDWTVTNPPYKQAVPFIHRALEQSRVGVAMLVRAAFIEGIGRHRDLFSDHPPTIYHFAERVPMFRGRVDPTGSTAAVYAWFVWEKDTPSKPAAGQYEIIGPCRRALEAPGDYEKPRQV